MQLIIDDKHYDLIEIAYPDYLLYTHTEQIPEPDKYFSESEPDENFEHVHYARFQTTHYKAIIINGKYYYPKLVENVV